MIYLDLDGVFADYRKGFAKVLGWDYHADPKLAWSILDQEPHLFRQLELLPRAKALLAAIESLAKQTNRSISFLTALPLRTNQLVSAEDDKHWWVRYVLESYHPIICVDNWSRKKDYADIGDILIDDSARNISDWESVGGRGVLYTGPASTCATLEYVLAG
jgi:5'(3')-deoxyribonucleotidase